jgi:hypothetical protein
MHSVTVGHSVCGKVVTKVIHHGPSGLYGIVAYTLGASVTALSLPFRFALNVLSES